MNPDNGVTNLGHKVSEFKPNQIVKVKEHHDANGIKLTKGTIGFIYPGETYTALGKDEVPVKFAFLPQQFLGVQKSKLEAVTEAWITTMSTKANAYDSLEQRLRRIQQKYYTVGNSGMIETILNMRLHFYKKSMKEIFEWEDDYIEKDFKAGEEGLERAHIIPYRPAPIKQ